MSSRGLLAMQGLRDCAPKVVDLGPKRGGHVFRRASKHPQVMTSRTTTVGDSSVAVTHTECRSVPNVAVLPCGMAAETVSDLRFGLFLPQSRCVEFG